MPDAHAHQLLDVLDIVDAWTAELTGVTDPGLGVVALLGVAGFLAGWVDAVVGGGGLIQLPALLIGLPGAAPAQVLATNKFALGVGHRDGGRHLLEAGAARPAHGAADGGGGLRRGGRRGRSSGCTSPRPRSTRSSWSC